VAGGVELDCSNEAMVDEHGGVAVVVVDTGGAAVPFDAHGNLVAADVDDSTAVHDDADRS
jgi:hypothetical protein